MRISLRALFFSLGLTGLIMQPSYAVNQAILTDAQIQSIQTNCQTAQVNLNTLHSNDAVLRVNLGERYLNVARRLMAPLNSRIALNGLNGVDMAQTTVLYSQGYQSFSKAYATYKTSVEKALNIDCRDQPVEFYSAVDEARDDRKAVAKVVDEMYRLGLQYRTQLERFAQNLSKAGPQL